MSNNFTTAVTAANEIIKAVDFTFAHDQAIANIGVAMQGILAKPDQDMVIGGAVRPYQSGGMNVHIEPIFAHCGTSGVDVVDTEINQPVSIDPADQALDRIDTIQVRGVVEPYDHQDRRFRDPETKVETTDNVPTKKRIKLEISVKKGSDGSVTAPQSDAGYVKLAEISVTAGTVSIGEDNIKNISARHTGAINGNWTNQKTRTFNPGYLTDIMEKFLVSHGENGKLKANAVLASMISFGTDSGDVNGDGIPTGLSMEIAGVQYNALTSMSQVLAALAFSVNLAYPHANNLFSRYVLLADTPVATSTENVNVITGGEITVDGIAVTVGQLVFLKNQNNMKENGFWEVQTGAWNRFIGYTAENSGAFNGRFIFNRAGTSNWGKVFYMEKESVIGTDNLVFHESIFSPYDLPGKVPIRDKNGRTIDDVRRESAIADAMQDMDSHADQIAGMGRNLLEVLGVSTIPEAMAEIRRRCNNNGEINASKIPDFSGIRIGDYIDGLDLSGISAAPGGTAPQVWNEQYKNNRIVVSGFNTYKGAGSTENTKNKILFWFVNVLCKGRINDTDTNTGGYQASKMRVWLEGANGDGTGVFAEKLKIALGGNYLCTISKYHSKKGSNSSDNYTVWLPTEIELWGRQTYGDELNYYNTNIHFPICQKSYAYLLKRENGSRAWYWSSTPTAAHSTTFCYVYYTGNANYTRADDTVGGVAPAFCVA
jgi:hypothetical protein